jgi:hypothetical protein
MTIIGQKEAPSPVPPDGPARHDGSRLEYCEKFVAEHCCDNISCAAVSMATIIDMAARALFQITDAETPHDWRSFVHKGSVTRRRPSGLEFTAF